MKLSKKHHAVAGHAPGVKVGQCVPHQCQPPKLAKNAPAAQNCHGKGNSFTCCWDFNGGAVATGWFNQTIASYTLEDFFCASRFKIVSNDVSIHPHVNFFPNVIGWSWDKELQRDPRWYWAHKSGPHTGFYVASQGKFDYCPAHVGGLCFHWYPEVKMWVVWAGGKAGTVAPGGKYMVSE